MSEFYTIVTNVGATKIANAEVTEQKLNITHYAVGDGNGNYYNPTVDQTTLRNEVWRGPATCTVDELEPNIINIDSSIPPETGGFMVREIGLFDADGDLVVVGKIAEYYKPIITQGSTLDAHLRTRLVVSNNATVVLKNDPNLITATRGYVDKEILRISGGIATLGEGFATHLDDDVSNGVHGMGSAAAQIYEDGLWTPKLDTTNTSYSMQQGTYSRIGNKVFIQARITLTSKGTTPSKLSISGIPYVGNNTALALIRIIASGLADPNKRLNGLVGGLNKIGIYSESNTSLTNAAAQLSIDDITDNTDLIVSGYYSI